MVTRGAKAQAVQYARSRVHLFLRSALLVAACGQGSLALHAQQHTYAITHVNVIQMTAGGGVLNTGRTSIA
jgi:hypothetical protein